MLNDFLFTSESVSEGHPDKICDRISDTVVDLMLAKFPEARVACETMVSTNRTIIAGEYRLPNGIEISNDEIERHVRKAVQDIGYEQENYHWEKMHFECHLHSQSADIALGVDQLGNKDEGAGDQGLMFGFACNETPSLMPAPIDLSHQLVKKQSEVRKDGLLPWLRPDAKSQVSVIYDDNRQQIKSLSAIVLSTQHDEDVSYEELKDGVLNEIIKPIIPSDWITNDTKILINPTGKFVIGGPVGDCGLTGRKIIVDTYGGMARHGGGAFSGKDPSKVDRSAAYACRYVAKNVVKAKLADYCEIQISYAIGVAEPTSISIDTFGTNKVSEEKISAVVKENFDFRPKNLIKFLDLKRPIYQNTAAYGHFGRNEFSWENTDLSDKFLSKE